MTNIEAAQAYHELNLMVTASSQIEFGILCCLFGLLFEVQSLIIQFAPTKLFGSRFKVDFYIFTTTC